MAINRKYGWKPDLPDARDWKFKKVGFLRASILPSKVDLRPTCPPVYDQMNCGSCTAQGIAAGHQFAQIKQNLSEVFLPSRLFIYFNEREMEGTINEDAGAMIRDGIKSVAKQGVCPESMWPYNISRFKDRPEFNCYTVAAAHTVASYERLDNTQIAQLKQCLAEGYPIVFGATLYSSFESDEVARTGMVPMPSPRESVIGGHAMCLVGYDDATKRFIVRNSWSEAWGEKGYCYIPYDYLTNNNLADDFWTMKLVNDNPVPDPVPEPVKPASKPWWKWLCFWS